VSGKLLASGLRWLLRVSWELDTSQCFERIEDANLCPTLDVPPFHPWTLQRLQRGSLGPRPGFNAPCARGVVQPSSKINQLSLRDRKVVRQ